MLRSIKLSKMKAFPRPRSLSAAYNRPFSVGIPHRAPASRVHDSQVQVTWDDKSSSKYHHIWLRDHCRCAECYQPVTKQRLHNTFELPADIKPIDVQSKPEGLQVTWPASSSSHTSLYPWDWLEEHTYEPRRPRQAPEKTLWGSEIAQNPPTVNYEEVMAEDGAGLYKWLTNIDKYGFCFVSGVPANPEATEEACKRIGFIRETHYGGFYDFTADLSRGDTAYSNLALGAHTDNTYFTDPCGIQLFHLLSHTEGSGGETLLVDGFHVASLLKKAHPDAYKILSTVPITGHAAGEEGIFYTATRPPLEHNAWTGELQSVRWNNDDRSVITDVPEGDMLKWYEAIRTWNKLLTSPSSEYWVQLTPGTLIGTPSPLPHSLFGPFMDGTPGIDNHRVLHGRAAFTGKRRMSGAYIGKDEFRSQLAVLKERFAGTGGERSVWNAGL
ncbi:Trimethyllysine dioxygenase [Dentipellis sp. KUC8613]|nr:Trimethyllysine dioxygenase [Dentipellis sp. KUC8613]